MEENRKNILILGGGGREHAIAFKLRENPDVGVIYTTSTNGGIASMKNCVCLPIKPLEIDKILQFLRENEVYLTIVSTDDALAMGAVDTLNQNGFRAFGPTRAAAQIEWSKAFAKEFMQKNGIPTAKSATFCEFQPAFEHIQGMSVPIVVKADGLALGKGVVICPTKQEAAEAVRQMLGGSFGESGKNVVIDEFVSGFEATILAFCDGKTVVPMVTSRDYKRALDGDKGLNTGGMGNISPMVAFEPYLKRAYDEIFKPTIDALSRDGRQFKGVIYYDVMVDESVTPAIFNVIEYNARFGDPEAQVVLPRLKTDLLEIMDACIDGRLDKIDIKWEKEPRVCVIAASKGYPSGYETGKKIAIGDLDEQTLVFHAGTRLQDGELFTSGGRVLAVVCKGGTVEEAASNAYKEMEKISFEGIFYRKDIGR